MTIVYVLAVIAASVAAFGVLMYNRFVKQENLCDEAFSGVQVQLKRRYDLIPNLVSCVKGYAAHERETLDAVIAKRNEAMNADAEHKTQAENALTQSLKSVFALAESYPDLKANQNFIQLQETLADIEDNLQNARRYYNATVRTLNTLVKSFPSSIIAAQFGFNARAYFEAAQEETQNVKVSF